VDFAIVPRSSRWRDGSRRSAVSASSKILTAVIPAGLRRAATIGWLGFDAIRTYGNLVAQISNASTAPSSASKSTGSSSAW